jgi:hypothetical protein
MQEYPTIARKAFTVLMQFTTSANLYFITYTHVCKESETCGCTENEIVNLQHTHPVYNKIIKKHKA